MLLWCRSFPLRNKSWLYFFIPELFKFLQLYNHVDAKTVKYNIIHTKLNCFKVNQYKIISKKNGYILVLSFIMYVWPFDINPFYCNYHCGIQNFPISRRNVKNIFRHVLVANECTNMSILSVGNAIQLIILYSEEMRFVANIANVLQHLQLSL